MGWLAPWAQVVEPTRSLPPVPSMAGPLTAQSPLTPCVCLSFPQVDPYLPYEYTCEGMLERIEAYIQHQVGGPSSPGTLLRSEEGPSQHTPRKLPLPWALHPLNSLLFLRPVFPFPSFQQPWGGGGQGKQFGLLCSEARPEGPLPWVPSFRASTPYHNTET